MSYNILILDDHPLIIAGIKLMLQDSFTYRVHECYSDLDTLLASDSGSHIDIILLDINVKGQNALDKIQQIKEIYNNSQIIAFSSYCNPSLINECKTLGLSGYLLKDTTKAELLICLKTVQDGELYYHNLEQKPMEVTDRWQLNTHLISINYKLSKRETDVFQRLIRGESEQDIAEHLYLSPHTVHTHNRNIKRKLNVNNVIQMMKLVFEEKYQ